jgi:hypothetical protein
MGTSSVRLRFLIVAACDAAPAPDACRSIGTGVPGPHEELIYLIGVSLDGFIAGPDGDIDWSAPVEELDRFRIFKAFRGSSLASV